MYFARFKVSLRHIIWSSIQPIWIKISDLLQVFNEDTYNSLIEQFKKSIAKGNMQALDLCWLGKLAMLSWCKSEISVGMYNGINDE